MQDGLGYAAITNNLKISVVVSNQLFFHSQEMFNIVSRGSTNHSHGWSGHHRSVPGGHDRWKEIALKE